MRVSDWSSDVCSSDLSGTGAGRHRLAKCGPICAGPPPGPRADRPRRSAGKGRSAVRPPRRASHADGRQGRGGGTARTVPVGRLAGRPVAHGGERGGTADRTSDVEGKRVAGREDLVGHRKIKKKKTK